MPSTRRTRIEDDAERAPRRRRRTRRALAAPFALLLALLCLAAPASAAQMVDVEVSLATGTAPFDDDDLPGNDSSVENDVIRSNDTLTFQIQVNVNDTDAGSSIARNVTVRQTLPDGLSFVRLPATCLTRGVTPVSEISGDGRSIVCNIGDLPTGVAGAAALPVHVDEMENGAVLTPAAGSIVVEADGATPDSATPDPVTVSSIPRVDMVKSAPTVTEVARGGLGDVPGYLLRYPVRVAIPNFGGRGLIGYEPPAAAMSLLDDFSGVSPNAEFVGCSDDDGGTWTCPAATARSPVTLNLVIADPSSIRASVLASTVVTIFIPRSDLASAPRQQLDTRNELRDLDARGPDGTPAVGEIESNNAANVVLTLDPTGAGNFSVYKHYVDVTASGRYIPGGANVDRNGYATVTAGQVFQGEVRVIASNPIAGFDDPIAACDVFDTATQRMTLAGPARAPAHGDGRPAWVTTATSSSGPNPVEGVDFVLEYSSDPTSGDPDDETRWAALRAEDCGGGTWTATPPATESAANDVTKVRMRFLAAPPRQFTLRFAVNLEALPGADGRVLANFAPYSLDDLATWVQPTYAPGTHGGARGDRLLLTTAQLTLVKDILEPASGPTQVPSVRGGSEVQFALRARVVAPSQSTAPGVVTARDVVVTDILPAGTSLVTDGARAPTPLPASVTANLDGTTTVVWELGTVTSEDEPQIAYWATIARTASGSKVNRAIVTSPDDAGSPDAVPSSGSDPHFAARTVNVDSLGGIQVDKQVDRPVVEPGDEVTFTVTYANLDLTPRSDMDSIDVLPFEGDGTAAGSVPGRAVASAYHGAHVLEQVVVTDGETVRYTDAPPAAVYATYDPTAAGQAGYGTLPGGYAWCTEAEIAAEDAGCPASIGVATAVRVTRTGPLAPYEVRSYSLTIRTAGSRSGDVYANTAALRSGSLLLGTLSPTRSVRVVASRVGDLVWEDRNENGRQDADEPGVPGVRVVLEGADKRSAPVAVETTTGADGRYLVTSSSQAGQDDGVLDLVSGTYRVTFDPATLPPRASFTLRNAADVDAAEDSDADRTTGVTADFAMPDPSPTGSDGENLTLDAGIVIAPEPPVPPAPPVAPPPVTPPVAPPVPEPSARPAREGTPRLTLRKRASVRAVRAGASVRYTLVVRNTGRAAARGVVLCDLLPDRVTLAGRPGNGGRLAAGRVCWRIGTLRAGARVTRTVTLRVDRDAPAGTVVNRATVTRDGAARVVRAARAVTVRAAPRGGVNPATGFGGVTG